MQRSPYFTGGLPGPARSREPAGVALILLLTGLFLAGKPPPGEARPMPQRNIHAAAASGAGPSSPRPNVLLFISDDQTWVTFSRALMPRVFAHLVDRGVLFERSYVNTSLCCPSRAEILTGLYEHHTGVDQNNMKLTRPNIVEGLSDLGYRTLLAGKYLQAEDCEPTPEYDTWVCSNFQPYEDPLLNVNGEWIQFQGYTTDILADFTVDFIATTPPNQPFFAMYSPKSPHLPGNDDRCDDLPVEPFRPPSFDEDTEASGKPQHMRRPPLTSEEIADIDKDHERMTQAVQCLDPAVGTILDSLGRRERNTLVLYLSDNGYLYGEHRATGKQWPYEESVRVPFVVRYPPLISGAAAFVSQALVQNVDIAPTIAELAGIEWHADGRSIIPLLSGEAGSIREGALLEHCQADHFPCAGKLPSFDGLATGRYKYVEYSTEEAELYDLASDPFELANVAGNPDWVETEAELAALLATVRAAPPTDTTIVTGPRGVQEDGGPFAFSYFSQSRFATYDCRLRTGGVPGPWFGCDGESTTIGPLDPEKYVFEVKGTDEFGLLDRSPAKRSFTVPTT
ncbi:hypothetical protein BH20ACT24_BH20ACT24_07910 [soil metagenome]